MKTNYKKVLISLAALCGAFAAKTQVATLYTFAQTASTYSAISGGTVFGSTTSDDQVFIDPAVPAGVGSGATGPGIPIGFNFMYNNMLFDRIGISNNGWIMLGTSSLGNAGINSNTSSNYTGISATSTAPGNLQNRIAILARDLQGQTGSELRVQTLGTAPTQTLVIQWTNYRKFGGTGDNFSFQIRLYETFNIVEFVYGSFATTTNASPGPEIGLRGSSNADYNNRVTNATNLWSASIAGTINTAAGTVSPSILPNSGQSYKWTPAQCSSSLTSLTATGSPSLVCPGGLSMLSLVNTYTESGITYSWSASVSSVVGPFTMVPGANSAAYTATNITVPMWFQSAATCLNSSQTVTSTAFGVQVAGTTTNSVPYLEDFEGIALNNLLPNCSWAASNPTNVCQTYTTAAANNRIPHSGNKFASFRSNTASAGDYFYTNGIQLNAGVTYSAGAWYTTDGVLGWNNFSILIGGAQTPTALTSIASISPASGTFYQLLSGTFTVASSGIYYLAIKCIANSTPQFMSFDDVFITVPCSLNTPAINLSTITSTVCAGTPVTISATGANQYMWNTGDVTSAITVTPNFNDTYVVTGTNTASGCQGSASQAITVNPSPVVSIFAASTTICKGSSLQVFGGGASTYTWITGTNGPTAIISPTVTSSVAVVGGNSFGCTGSATLGITVNALPNVSASTSLPNQLCVGETAVLTGSGAITYQWNVDNVLMTGQQISVSPSVTTVYSVSGTDANGCSNVATVIQNVDPCTGLKELNGSVGLKAYPNPTEGHLIIEINGSYTHSIQITDLSGRILRSYESSGQHTDVDMSHFAAGIYYVKVVSASSTETIKVIKN
jgi:hypothetical protein